ncbi:c-type cytochrome [Sedimentitalea todarodis]|uniref:Cytochrome c family protein n=1 Tax=Sedimentitalea todarodis TaxID=1631240 RepID=A0ABU3V9K5_9RHOB|nr:cytochrome c family protein [Sedimentitalea todarodis]MDU9002861.1 cytochrome c family protein [Sedimentitalea todarodis]
MDTMTYTKAAAGFLGALLVLLLANWAAGGLYHVGGHGDAEAAYVIEVDEGEAAEETAEVSFDEMMMAADVDKGAKVFKKCSACHKLEDGANSTGPYLYGVVGRPVASVSGFGYSDAMAAAGGDWTPDHLNEFLTKPSDAVPGTTMSFAGLKKIDDRVNLIAYLNSNSDSPFVIEAAAETTEAEEVSTEDAAAEEAAGEEGEDEAKAAEDGAAAEEANADAEAATDETSATEEAPATEEEAPTEEEASTTEEAPAEESSAASEETATATAAIAGDPEAGAKVFKKCAACHKLEDGKNTVGPHLFGVVDRPIANVDGFKYSDTLAGLGGEWTADRLAEFLEKPRDFAPGTKMSFAGLRKEEDRQNVIAYLNTIGN